jgi:hypothetical protein
MRMMVCLFLLLSGCMTHAVRCDGHLVPINLPAGGAAPRPAEGAEAGAAVAPAGMPPMTPPTRRGP